MKHSKIDTIQTVLKFYEIQCWIMYSDEKSDAYLEKYITDKVISQTICIITQSKAFIIASSLDFDNLKSYENVINLSYGLNSGQTLFNLLEYVLKEIDYPETVHLSYTTMQDALVDVLGHGMFITLSDMLKDIYGDRSITYQSAEKVIYAIAERREETDIIKMKLAANRADEILTHAFTQIKIGMSELDIVEMVHKYFEIKPDYFQSNSIVKEEYSWNKEFCPTFICGPNFVKGGHAMPSSTKVEAGFTLYFDFGVKLTFSDGSQFSSDIQRMGYILKSSENTAPTEVLDIFDTLHQSITTGIGMIKPGIKGYEVDEVVRGFIQSKGYVDYDHATGHSIGEVAHNPGALLGPKTRGLSNLVIQPNAVYTIEPRIPISNGGSIEEMVLVTENGGVAISPRQNELIIIRG